MKLRIVALISAFGLLATACAITADQTLDPVGTDHADGAADQNFEELGAPELETLSALIDDGFNGIVAIATPDDLNLMTAGSAEPDAEVGIDTSTVFDIGSITKQFTAAGIVSLHSEGRLSVDDRVGDHLDGLTPEQADITLHQLLTHTAGLPPAIGPDYQPIDRDEYIALVADTPLQDVPGEVYDYSNVGYSLLAAVIEVVTGESYESYLRTALFIPADMGDTGYVLADWSDNVIASGWVRDEVFGRPNEQVWSATGPYWHLKGNGGIMSTADDMLKWDEALRGDDVLDEAAKELMFTPHVSEGGDTFYGYGWVIQELDDGQTLIKHNGGNGVFFADFLRFVDHDTTIFLATNSADRRHESAAAAIAAEVLGAPVADAAGLECPPIIPEDLIDEAAINEFPDTAVGRGAERVFTVATAEPGSITAAELSKFNQQFIQPQVAPGVTDAELAEQIRSLQSELQPFTLEKTVALGDGAFAALFVDGADSLVVSVKLSETEPAHLVCLNVDG